MAGCFFSDNRTALRPLTHRANISLSQLPPCSTQKHKITWRMTTTEQKYKVSAIEPRRWQIKAEERRNDHTSLCQKKKTPTAKKSTLIAQGSATAPVYTHHIPGNRGWAHVNNLHGILPGCSKKTRGDWQQSNRRKIPVQQTKYSQHQ